MAPETTAVQDYLKTIYLVAAAGDEVTTSAIAERLGVSAPSVTAMVKKLAERKLVRYTPYREIRLTPSGEALAVEVVRHHRLLEAYLHDVLGLSWDEVHEEAEVLEHALSERLEDRIAEALGHPTHDPHGDPIPPKNGEHTEVRFDALDAAPPGNRMRVERVSDRDPEALRYLARLGIRPRAELTVTERAPFDGPIWVEVGGVRHALGRALAGIVFVSPVAERSTRPTTSSSKRSTKGPRAAER
jgi:DtxR family transcriptional regulator, Mn-dependent transcriptional regulator